jgi:CheY-like chemotaxis protein
MPMTSESIIQWLPRLRRYAHALSGTRELGDSYVRACLEVAVEEPQRFSKTSDVGLELFRLFHDIWTIVDEGCGAIDESDSGDVQLKRQIADLPSMHRQVLLLSALEGFTPDEIAWILDRPEAEVEHKLEEARTSLKHTSGARILIIEDRPSVAASMSDLVGSLGHTVVGVARREGDAVRLAEADPPELVLADIELGTGDRRIGAVRRVVGSVHAPVVLVTASPDFFWHHDGSLESAVIVSKPFDRRALQLAIGQALSAGAHARTH